MDKVLYGLSVAGIGMLVVFFGLVVLIFCVKAMSSFAAGGKRKKSEPVVPAPAPAVAPVAAAPAVEAGISADVIAAITAAIAAVWEGEKGFVVRHVKRVSNAPAWSRAGREEQTYSRF